MLRTLSPDEIAAGAERLDRDGYVIVPNVMDAIECDRVLACLHDLHARQRFGDNGFAGTRTKRVFNLFAKTRGLDALLAHEGVVALAESRLGAGLQLSIASTMEIHGGETAQPLHQDDAYFPAHPHPPLVINTMWALTDFTEANGATRLVPGSHRLDEPVNPAATSIAAAMPRGSVLLWDGSLWHGGGANTTDDARFGLSLNYCRGWIRQQENQYLSLDPKVVSALPEEVQKHLGYDICQFVGWVDGRHPMRAILPEVRERIHRGGVPAPEEFRR